MGAPLRVRVGTLLLYSHPLCHSLGAGFDAGAPTLGRKFWPSEACKVVRMILQQEPCEASIIRSDSLHVICMLKGEFETNANLGDVRELLTQWMHVKEAVRLQHVRAHKGDNSNEMADANAKLAAEAGELIPQATFRADGAFAFFRGGVGGGGLTTGVPLKRIRAPASFCAP